VNTKTSQYFDFITSVLLCTWIVSVKMRKIVICVMVIIPVGTRAGRLTYVRGRSFDVKKRVIDGPRWTEFGPRWTEFAAVDVRVSTVAKSDVRGRSFDVKKIAIDGPRWTHRLPSARPLLLLVCNCKEVGYIVI